MEREFEIILFINDLFAYTEKLKKKPDYEMHYYSLQSYFKFYHPGAILDPIIASNSIDDCEIKEDTYYILYDLLERNYISLDHLDLTQLKYIQPDNTLINLLETKANNQKYILSWNYITKKLESINRNLSKFQSFNKNNLLKIFENNYLTIENLLKQRFSSNSILLDTILEADSLGDVEYYIDSHLYLLMSIHIYIRYIYSDACNDGRFLAEHEIRKFIEFIIEKFYSYRNLRKTIYFNIYPRFMANADGRQCCASIYIDFEIDDLLKLLLLIEMLDTINKI